MARFRKTVIRPGEYLSPDGPVHIDAARLHRWAHTFRQMASRGIKIPFCWGHQPDGRPEEDEADYQNRVARYTAGYLTDLYVDPLTGGLVAEGDAPGVEPDGKGHLVHWVRLPDGREVKSAVGEVSIGIDDWTDGSGRCWPDSIIHLAATPLPVWHGQDGF